MSSKFRKCRFRYSASVILKDIISVVMKNLKKNIKIFRNYRILTSKKIEIEKILKLSPVSP